MHHAAQIEFFQRLDRLAHRSQGRHTHVFDENRLRCGSSTLHTIDHHHVGAGDRRQLDVIEGAGCTDLDIDGFFPVSDLSQFLDFDHQIVGAGPVRVPAGRPLVHPFRQVPHTCHTGVDFLP